MLATIDHGLPLFGVAHGFLYDYFPFLFRSHEMPLLAAPKGMEIIHLQVTAHGIVGFVCLVDPIALVSLHATPHRCWLLLHASLLD